MSPLVTHGVAMRRGRACALLAVALLGTATSDVVAQARADSATILPGVRAPARLVGASRAVIDSLDIARSSATTLSELLQARAPSVGVMMSGGRLTDGGRVLIRGPSTLATGGAPLLIVDGIRADEQEDDSISTASRLDDIAIEDIATVEILRGPAAAALFGGGASSGVILVTTKRGGAGGWRVGGRVLTAARQFRGRLPDDWQRHGTTPEGGPVANCPLDFVTSLCIPGALERWNPLAESSLLHAGMDGRASLALAGGGAGHTARLSVTGRDAGGVVSDERVSQLFSRVAVTQRVVRGLELDASAAYAASRSQRSGLGDVLSLALADRRGIDPGVPFRQRMEYLLQQPREGRMRHLSGGAGATWRARDWLTLRGSITRDRVNTDATRHDAGWTSDYSTLAGLTRDDTHEGRSVRRESRGTAELSHTLSRSGNVTGRLVVGTERTVRERSVADSSFFNALNLSWSRWWNRRVNNAVFAMGRITVGDRLALGAGARRERDTGADTAFRVYPSADVVWLSPRRVAAGTLRARAAYGEAAQPFADFERIVVAPPPEFSYGGFAPPQIRIPERMREVEGGVDLDWDSAGAVGLSFYHRRIANLFSIVQGPLGASVESRGATSHGLEVDARVTVLHRSAVHWELRALGATQRTRVVGGDYATYTPSFDVTRNGAPLHAVTGAPPIYADTNGDGLLSIFEFTRRAVDADLRPSTPPFQGALHSVVAIGRRLELTTIVDRQSGQYVFPSSELTQCGPPNCREAQDPASTIDEQAHRWDLLTRTAFADASFTRLREVSVRWALGGTRSWRGATVVVAGRDLALWTRWRGLDPEIDTNRRSATVQSDDRGVPLPRRLTVGVELGGGGGRL
jgi:TonB-dependent SusC/RagA subfamily outer membrane receptor